MAAASAGGADAPGGGGLDVELAASGFQREHAEVLDRWVAAAAQQAGGGEGEGREDDAEDEAAASSGDNEEGLTGLGNDVAGVAAQEDGDGSAGSSSKREDGGSDAGRKPDRQLLAEALVERLRLDAGPRAATPLGSAGSSRPSSEGCAAEARDDAGGALDRRGVSAEGSVRRAGEQLAAGAEHVSWEGRPPADTEDLASEADGLRAQSAAERRTVQARVHNEGRARARTAASQRASRGSMKAAVKKGRRQAAGGAVF